MAAAPSIGRASAVESPPAAPEADLTRALYERYAGQIYGFCLHKLGSREEAEDAVQNTFLNAFRGLRRGVVPQAESAWLFKIAENVCLSRHRSTYRRGRVESPSDLQAIQDVLPSPERRGDDLIGLQGALERMPETQRRAILLREWQGLSYREIAEEMDLTQAAVETLIFRARRTLAQGLEEEPRTRGWKRLRQGADAGSILALLKTIFAGGAAVKAVATAVAVGTAVVVASSGSAVHLGASHPGPARTPAVAPTSVVFGQASSTGAAPSRAVKRRVDPGGAPGALPAGSLSSISSVPGEGAVAAVTPADPATPAAPAVTPPPTQPTATADPAPAPATPQPPPAAAVPKDTSPPAATSPALALAPAPAVPKQITPAPADSVPKQITPAPVNSTPSPVVPGPQKKTDPVPPAPTAAPIQVTMSVVVIDDGK